MNPALAIICAICPLKRAKNNKACIFDRQMSLQSVKWLSIPFFAARIENELIYSISNACQQSGALIGQVTRHEPY